MSQGYDTKEEAREAANGGGVKKISGKWVPAKSSSSSSSKSSGSSGSKQVVRVIPKSQAGAHEITITRTVPAGDSSIPHGIVGKSDIKKTLPQGAQELPGGRIKYKGLTYSKDTFYEMQAGGKTLGKQDDPNKDVIVYKSKLSDMIRDEYASYNPQTGELDINAPEGSSTRTYLSGIIENVPSGYTARKTEKGYVIEEQPITEMRLGFFDIPVNDGYVSSKPIDITPMVITSTPLRGGSGGGGSSGGIRQKEAQINKAVEDFIVFDAVGNAVAGMQENVKQIFPDDPVRQAIVGNTIGIMNAPRELSKVVFTTGLKFSEADLFNTRPIYAPNSLQRKAEGVGAIAEDTMGITGFLGHQAMYTGSSFIINPAGATMGMAYWSMTDLMPAVIGAYAFTGALEGGSRLVASRMPVKTDSLNVNVVRAQASKGGKTYTYGESYALTTSKHPLSSAQSAKYYGQFEQVSLQTEGITGPVGSSWEVGAYGNTRGVLSMGGKNMPVLSEYYLSPQITVLPSTTPGTVSAMPGGFKFTPGKSFPGVSGYRGVSYTVMDVPGAGISRNIWAGNIIDVSKQMGNIFPIQGAQAYYSTGSSVGTYQGITSSTSFVFKPPLFDSSLPAQFMRGAGGAGSVAGAGKGTAQMLVMQETGMMGTPASTLQAMGTMTQTSAMQGGITIAADFGRAMGNILGVGGMGGALTRQASKQTAAPLAMVSTTKQSPITELMLTQSSGVKVKAGQAQVISTKSRQRTDPINELLYSTLTSPRAGTTTTTRTLQGTKQSPLQKVGTAMKPLELQLTAPVLLVSELPLTKTQGSTKPPQLPILPLLPLMPMLPSGFTGHKSPKAGKAKGQGKKYKPSLLGVGIGPFKRVVISKAPSFVTGGGIRGVIEMTKEKKTKGKKKKKKKGRKGWKKMIDEHMML